tara:strand:+ start:111 stop:548 length:438 start_codon:yes stop_codon:yes gene_type:complete
MNSPIGEVLNAVNIDFETLSDEGNSVGGNILILRDTLIDNDKYEIIKEKIPLLKKHFSSSVLTSLQLTAEKKQKWPLLNLVRQILKSLKYEMKPIRKSNGYTKNGKKIYVRYFFIQKMKPKSIPDTPNDVPSDINNDAKTVVDQS